MITVDELKQVVASLREQLAAAGRSDEGFAVQVASSDRYGLEGYRELVEIGATDIVTVPWVFYGVPLDGPLEAKQDGLRRFAAEVIDRW